MSMIRIFSVFLVMLLALPAAANENIQPSVQYRACMAKAKRFPKDAFEDAIQWRDMGGGAAAEHCAAYALIQLGLYKDAAARLERLAERINEKPAFNAQLLGQASQAWLLANIPDRAVAVASAALKLRPGDVDLLLDRAQALAQLGDYAGARTDLDLVISKAPEHADALAFRAAAKRYMKDRAGALSDAERALDIEFGHVAALLERGNLRRLDGDDNGARADWLMVLSLQPQGEAAEAARQNLEKMDVNVGK